MMHGTINIKKKYVEHFAVPFDRGSAELFITLKPTQLTVWCKIQ